MASPKDAPAPAASLAATCSKALTTAPLNTAELERSPHQMLVQSLGQVVAEPDEAQAQVPEGNAGGHNLSEQPLSDPIREEIIQVIFAKMDEARATTRQRLLQFGTPLLQAVANAFVENVEEEVHNLLAGDAAASRTIVPPVPFAQEINEDGGIPPPHAQVAVMPNVFKDVQTQPYSTKATHDKALPPPHARVNDMEALLPEFNLMNLLTWTGLLWCIVMALLLLLPFISRMKCEIVDTAALCWCAVESLDTTFTLVQALQACKKVGEVYDAWWPRSTRVVPLLINTTPGAAAVEPQAGGHKGKMDHTGARPCVTARVKLVFTLTMVTLLLIFWGGPHWSGYTCTAESGILCVRGYVKLALLWINGVSDTVKVWKLYHWVVVWIQVLVGASCKWVNACCLKCKRFGGKIMPAPTTTGGAGYGMQSNGVLGRRLSNHIRLYVADSIEIVGQAISALQKSLSKPQLSGGVAAASSQGSPKKGSPNKGSKKQ